MIFKEMQKNIQQILSYIFLTNTFMTYGYPQLFWFWMSIGLFALIYDRRNKNIYKDKNILKTRKHDTL